EARGSRGASGAARLADVRQEAVRLGLRDHRRELDQSPRSGPIRLHHLAFEPVEGTELRPLQEPEGRRGARGGAAHRGPGRAEEALCGVLQALDAGRALRVPLLPAAGLRHAAELRRLRAHSHVRRHLPVAQERPLDREVTAGGELVDIVDKSGRTIATTTRAEMRAKRLPHRSADLLVFNRRGELFVHLRTPTKDVLPSHWDVTVGGVLAAGESFDDGARREAGEELGVAVAPQRLFPVRYSDEHSDVFGMAYHVVHDGPFRLQPEEIVRGEFVAPADVAECIAARPFCPDGLAVYEEYRRSTSPPPGRCE